MKASEIIREGRIQLHEKGRTFGAFKRDSGPFQGLCLLGALLQGAGYNIQTCAAGEALGWTLLKSDHDLAAAVKFTADEIRFRDNFSVKTADANTCFRFNDGFRSGVRIGDGEVFDVLDAAEMRAKEAEAERE